MKVLIVDDHQIVRSQVRALLRDSQWDVCGEAVNGNEAVRLAQKLHPDIILMDVYMPDENGIAATRQISELYPEIKILMLTVQPVPEVVWVSLASGAKGYVFKPDAAKDLLPALDAVAAGQTYLSPSIEFVCVHSLLRPRNESD